MTPDRASNILKKMIDAAANGERATTVHLFGITHSTELDGMQLQEIAEGAGLTKSWGTEIRKGINLSQYVIVKPEGSVG